MFFLYLNLPTTPNEQIWDFDIDSNLVSVHDSFDSTDTVTKVKVVGKQTSEGKQHVDSIVEGRTDIGTRQVIYNRNDKTTLEEHKFTEAGTFTIRVKAVTAGKNSNVAADTIIMMKNPVKNVEAITNPNQVTSGTEAESDSSLRQRIDDFYAGHGASYVGNKADYELWAREVATRRTGRLTLW